MSVSLDAVAPSKPAFDDRPFFVKAIHVACEAEVAALVAWYGWAAIAEGPSFLAIALMMSCAMGLVGLWTRVAWGRFIFSCNSLLIAITIVAALTPQPDDNYDAGGPALQRLFGTMPSVWAAWLTIVFGATLPLIPAVIVGWRKHWFRSAWW